MIRMVDEIYNEYKVAAIRQHLHDMNQEGSYGTLDEDIMRRFYDVYRDVIRLEKETGEWWIFNGQCWEPDNRNSKMLGWFMNVQKHAKEVNQARRNQLIEEDKKGEDSDEVKALNHRIKVLTNATEVNKALSLIKNGLVIFPDLLLSNDDFDAKPGLINFKNGTLDAMKLRLIPGTRTLDRQSVKDAMHKHDPRDMIRQIIPYDLDADAPEGVVFRKFVSEIHNDDLELIDFVQRSEGYSITGYVNVRCIWIQQGSGDNGKSTYNALIYKSSGTYAETATIDLLLYSKKNNSYEQNIQLATLRGKRIVMINEPEIERSLDTGALKRLTGGDDRIPARILNKGYISYKFQGHVRLATNNRPAVNDQGNSVWKRIIEIPYRQSFTDRIDMNLFEKLEKDIEDVLIWRIEGLAKWMADEKQLHKAKAVVDSVNDYRVDNDDLREYIESCFEVGSQLDYVTSQHVYLNYRGWCDQLRIQPLEERIFRRRLCTRDGWKSEQKKLKGHNIRIFRGWKVILDFKPTISGRVEFEQRGLEN